MHRSDIARVLLALAGWGATASALTNQAGIKAAVGDNIYNVFVILGAIGAFASTLVNTLYSPASSSKPSPPNQAPPQNQTPAPPLTIVPSASASAKYPQ